MMRSSTLRFGCRRFVVFLMFTILLVGPLSWTNRNSSRTTRTTAVYAQRLLQSATQNETESSSSSNANNNNNNEEEPSSSQVLTEDILQLALLTGIITLQIGDTDDRSPCKDGCTDDFTVLENGPSSWAVVTKTTSGHCLIVFSDSTESVQDWLLENLDPRSSEYCDENNTGQCCRMRRGFARSYLYSGFQMELEDAIKACADSTCSNTEEQEDCVVLGGFSQGAATAAVASMHLSELYNPIVIGMGSPPAVFPDCALINTQKWFQFINTSPRTTRWNKDDGGGLAYDIVPFSPGLGAVPLGHSFVLTDDTSGPEYLGMNTLGNILGPFDVNAHSLRSDDKESDSANPGLLDRIESILQNQGNNKMDSSSNVSSISSISSSSSSSSSFVRPSVISWASLTLILIRLIV